jgi:hypothetical protein
MKFKEISGFMVTIMILIIAMPISILSDILMFISMSLKKLVDILVNKIP